MSICIYHGNCADGFGAAWAVWKRFPDWDFVPGIYGEAPPDVTGRDVVLVDFSYKRPVLLEMAEKARSILVLDHHKTAEGDLAGLPTPPSGIGAWLSSVSEGLSQNVRMCALFDMERSGAVMAWEFFHPGEDVPVLLQHIQDRDLWRFELGGTREIQACVFSYPYDFELWSRLVADAGGGHLHTMFAEGQAIERKHHKDIAELVRVCARPAVIGGYHCWMASLPYTLTSDAGHLMCEMPLGQGGPTPADVEMPAFAACYWDTPKGRTFSLRSVGDFDVQAVAAKYGGGGHKNAAGFEVAFDCLSEDGSPAAAGA